MLSVGGACGGVSTWRQGEGTVSVMCLCDCVLTADDLVLMLLTSVLVPMCYTGVMLLVDASGQYSWLMATSGHCVLDARLSSVTTCWLMAIWMNVAHAVAAHWPHGHSKCSHQQHRGVLVMVIISSSSRHQCMVNTSSAHA